MIKLLLALSLLNAQELTPKYKAGDCVTTDIKFYEEVCTYFKLVTFYVSYKERSNELEIIYETRIPIEAEKKGCPRKFLLPEGKINEKVACPEGI